jgi:hypothetical protein
VRLGSDRNDLLHVLLRDASAVAAAGHLREIDAMFLGDLSGRRSRTLAGSVRQVRRVRQVPQVRQVRLVRQVQ